MLIKASAVWPVFQTYLCTVRPAPRACVCIGFFENKEADAKARGQKLPKKKDPKEEFDNFLKSIEGTLYTHRIATLTR